MQFYSEDSLELNVGRRRTLLIRLILLMFNLASMKRNPNLSKFGLLIDLDLPIQKTNGGEISKLRLFRSLVYYYDLKTKEYTFFPEKCTQRFRFFQNSSTSRTRILIG